jgi:serine/threonine-protein kinase
MTNTDRHAKIKAAFLKIVAKPESEQSAALEELCGEDTEMRREVETLLRFSGDAGQTISISGDKPPRFNSGDQFASRYRIVALLGRGAIGEVYRAEDTTLGVEVALKLLINPSPGLVDRLLEEVRLARQVTHPSICRVFDVGHVEGEYFFTMEYVDGEDLQHLLERIGRLPADKVREIGIQICEGLAAAHALGVLHRDLKPSNVMLDAAGAVRITDFGVAVSVAQSGRDLVSGTPAYMAPEQLLDHAAATTATDLYAVGLILYEAATGKPISGADTNDTTSLRKNQSFPKPSALVPFIPDDLEELILELLRANPDERPGSATEIADRLRLIRLPDPTKRRRLRAALAAAALGVVAVGFFLLGGEHRTRSFERASHEHFAAFRPKHDPASEIGIAVLTFEDMNDRTGDEHLVEGLQDELIELLSKVEGLRVIDEDSVEHFERNGGTPSNARTRLGADYVTFGRVDEQDGRLHLMVRLIDTKSEESAWEQEYDRSTEELDDVEHRICDRIVRTLRKDENFSLPREPPRSRNLVAANLYRHGMLHSPPRNPEQFRKSVERLEEAIAEDPEMAAGYTKLGTSYIIAAMNGWIETRTGFETARSNAIKALQRNERASAAHVVLALVQGDFDWDWEGAEESYRRALDLNPSSSWAYRSYARFLSSQSRFDEAIDAANRAFQISPRSPFVIQGIARRYYEARNYKQAQALGTIAVEFDPDFPPSYATLCMAYLADLRFGEAVGNCRKYSEITDGRSDALALLAYAYARAGHEDEARETIQKLETRDGLRGVELAALALAEHDTDAAVNGLARAVDQRERPSIWLVASPIFDPLRTDSRFKALVQRVGLPAAKDNRDAPVLGAG